MKNSLEKIFNEWSGETVQSITPLPISGSNRQYFRIKSVNHQAVGVYSKDKNENFAYLGFTKHFLNKKLNVPRTYADNLNENVYLIEDLGDETLFDYLAANREENEFPEEAITFYKSALEKLIEFQLKGSKEFDYSICNPRASFDKQSMMWDLNYFKYYFLKLTSTPFNEQKLEDDFNKFTEFLLSAPSEFFLYRDFQSRNIMIKNNQLFFIDYQGGRKGALQYDVASLLFDAKANIPQDVRDRLLNHYLQQINNYIKIDSTEFTKFYFGYVLIRILQAMGAYGFRGIHERKAHFLKSIPYAVKNISYLISNNLIPNNLNELKAVLTQIIRNNKFNRVESISPTEKLIVSINSFSYKSGIPVDHSGNDGGFVFDCRSLHNPGRYDEYKMLTGKDKQVVEFLNNQADIKEFLEDVRSIVDRAVNNYLQRNFTNLMINFGCTGGQHRSVFLAEELAHHIKKKFNVEVSLNHTELDKKEMI